MPVTTSTTKPGRDGVIDERPAARERIGRVVQSGFLSNATAQVRPEERGERCLASQGAVPTAERMSGSSSDSRRRYGHVCRACVGLSTMRRAASTFESSPR